MTRDELRAQFAGQAMAAYISGGEGNPERFHEWAVNDADALLSALGMDAEAEADRSGGDTELLERALNAIEQYMASPHSSPFEECLCKTCRFSREAVAALKARLGRE